VEDCRDWLSKSFPYEEGFNEVVETSLSVSELEIVPPFNVVRENVSPVVWISVNSPLVIFTDGSLLVDKIESFCENGSIIVLKDVTLIVVSFRKLLIMVRSFWVINVSSKVLDSRDSDKVVGSMDRSELFGGLWDCELLAIESTREVGFNVDIWVVFSSAVDSSTSVPLVYVVSDVGLSVPNMVPRFAIELHIFPVGWTESDPGFSVEPECEKMNVSFVTGTSLEMVDTVTIWLIIVVTNLNVSVSYSSVPFAAWLLDWDADICSCVVIVKDSTLFKNSLELSLITSLFDEASVCDMAAVDSESWLIVERDISWLDVSLFVDSWSWLVIADGRTGRLDIITLNVEIAGLGLEVSTSGVDDSIWESSLVLEKFMLVVKDVASGFSALLLTMLDPTTEKVALGESLLLVKAFVFDAVDWSVAISGLMLELRVPNVEEAALEISVVLLEELGSTNEEVKLNVKDRRFISPVVNELLVKIRAVESSLFVKDSS
jgi:hypothetical protein